MTRKADQTPNAGTCAICGRVWMLTKRGPNKGRLVNHGYERPWGAAEQTEGCFGAKSEPYEQSTEIIVRYLEVLARAHDFATQGLANLRARPAELSDRDDHGQIVFIRQDHPRYELRLRRAVAERESELRAIESDQKRMRLRLDQWPGVRPLRFKDPTARRGAAGARLTYDEIEVGRHYKLHRALVRVERKERGVVIIRLEGGAEYTTGPGHLRPASPEFIQRRLKVIRARRKARKKLAALRTQLNSSVDTKGREENEGL